MIECGIWMDGWMDEWMDGRMNGCQLVDVLLTTAVKGDLSDFSCERYNI